MSDRRHSGTREPVDVLIVGSGFGGAVAALRLAEHGIHTVMLERGKEWPIASQRDGFSSLENPDGRSSWLSDHAVLSRPDESPKPIDRHVGVLELSLEDGIAAFAGAGVGGGSLVYAGVLYQPTRRLFLRTFGETVSYDEMDGTYYPRVRAELEPRRVPSRLLYHPHYSATRAWRALGEMADLRTRFLELGVHWPTAGLELVGLKPASITGSEFWYGNNSGAKNSLDKNYLRKARARRKLDILTQHVVSEIEQTANGCYAVTAKQIDESGVVLSEKVYIAKKLFLAAGSLGTSKLLVRARAHGKLPKLSDEVGLYWGNNGDFFGTLDGFSARTLTDRGGTATAVIEDHDNEKAPIAIECYSDWTKSGSHGEVSFLGMSPVPALGQFRYNAQTDAVTLHWPYGHAELARHMEAARATVAKLTQATPEGLAATIKLRACHAGLRVHATRSRGYVSSGQSSTPEQPTLVDNATAHPLGGVVLGKATDNVGTVLHYPGLYVIDGALMPGNTACTNPALTIAALAERNIERVIARDFA